LLLTIHHLVVDAISWGILLPSLVTAYNQIIRGDQVSLPAATTSYLQWAKAQMRWAKSEKMQREVHYWRETGLRATVLPQDGTGSGSNTEGKAKLVTVTLDSAHTEKLLREAHLAYHTRIDDLLLAALLKAFTDWTDQQSLLLTLERHGREDFDPGLNLSQTVGWFTSLLPLNLLLPDEGDAGARIRAVKEQLRAVPNNGVGYGMLRYLGDGEIRQMLAEQPQPEVLFNYLGVRRAAKNDTEPIRPLIADTGQLYGPENKRAHLIDVNARVEKGLLAARWQYAPDYFQQSTIEKVAKAFIQELGRLIDHCLAVEQARHTPSDFPLANLQQDDLDSLSDLLSELE
jgi:non-ribosomal peptide synthase protein (TIGR01720 family)